MEGASRGNDPVASHPSRERVNRRAHFSLWFFVGLISGFAPRAARAHASYSPSLNNRYLKVALSGGGAVRLAYAVLYGETPSIAARRGADENGDGTLDEREVGKLAAGVRDAVARGLAVTVDGRPAAPAWEPPIPGIPDARVGPLPFSIDLVGVVKVAGGGPHVVTLDDATPLPDLGETEVRIEEGPGTRVLQAWHARDDGGRQMRFLWNGPKYTAMEDRSIGFRFVDDTATRRKPSRRLPIAIAGVLVAAVAGGVLVARSRRRRS